MNTPINPFTFGKPIDSRERFIGRQEEIRQITSRLLGAGESTSIVGERRIGKTSLLKYLANPENAEVLGLHSDRFCMVYIDFQGLTDITPQRFWQRILRKMEKTICKEEIIPEIQNLRQQSKVDLFDLEDFFEITSKAGLTIVLMMDEFEYVTQNPNFHADFFGGLRALAIHRDLPLITSTRRELVDLCHSDEIKGSPFFNIFVNLVLRPFSTGEVFDLLKNYADNVKIELDDKEQEIILELSGGFPFFLQMAGYYLIEARIKGLQQKETVHQVVAKFDEQAESHFNYFWSHTSESEKITLLNILTLNQEKLKPKIAPTLENVARLHSKAVIDIPELVKRGLLLTSREDPKYQIFSTSFSRWIAREITASGDHSESTESLEDWIQEGGVDLSDVSREFLPKFKKKYWPLVWKLVDGVTHDVISAAAIEMVIRSI